jgi:hypothetical protein
MPNPPNPSSAAVNPAPPPPAALLAVPGREVTRLRNDVERVRMRVSGWRAELRRRSESA